MDKSTKKKKLAKLKYNQFRGNQQEGKLCTVSSEGTCMRVTYCPLYVIEVKLLIKIMETAKINLRTCTVTITRSVSFSHVIELNKTN